MPATWCSSPARVHKAEASADIVLLALLDLGAQSGDVLRLVGAAGIRLAPAGTMIGAIGAFALTRFLSGLLFGVSSADSATFAAMAAMLIAVTLLACYIPARRASKVDPLIALRYE
jgi:ABC-type antimicrobial peptide transport system permease subunit